MPRRLTNRQAAVLAAVERRGRTTVDALGADFRDVASSTLVRTLDRLHELGHVDRAGDPSLVYVGGVEFWARPREPTSPTVVAEAVLARLRHEFGDHRAWLHPGRHDVVLAGPLVDISQALQGDDAPLTRIAGFVAMLRREGTAVSLTVGAEISSPQGEASIVVHLKLSAT